MSPALIRFREYRTRALDLEERKGTLRRSSPAMRQLHGYVMWLDEAALDRGWEEVVRIAEGFSGEAAEVICEHYLWCVDWHDVAAGHRMGYDEAKKLSYRAFLWLDGQGENG